MLNNLSKNSKDAGSKGEFLNLDKNNLKHFCYKKEISINIKKKIHKTKKQKKNSKKVSAAFMKNIN